MPNNNELDNFLDGLDESPKDALAPATEDPLEQPITEKQEDVEEKPLPFNKDPKIQRFIQKEIEKATKGLKPTETEKFVKDVAPEDEGEAILNRIIGNDTPEKVQAVKDFKKYLSSLEEKGAQKAIQQLERQEQESIAEDREAEEELSSGFERVEEEFGVDLSSDTKQAADLRNDFIDFITRIAPKDREGQVVEFPDFEEAYSLFRDTRKPQPNNKAKQLSSRSMSRSSDASTIKTNKGTSWKDVDRMFENLK